MNIVKKFVYQKVVPVVGTLLKSKNKYINVIYYHDIIEGEGNGAQQTNIQAFKKQMEYIASNGYKTVTFDDLENGADISFNEKYVLITFDDGWLSNYSIFEFMKENIPAARYRIEVKPDNEKAKALYERMGFEVLPYLQMVIDKQNKENSGENV